MASAASGSYSASNPVALSNAPRPYWENAVNFFTKQA